MTVHSVMPDLIRYPDADELRTDFEQPSLPYRGSIRVVMLRRSLLAPCNPISLGSATLLFITNVGQFRGRMGYFLIHLLRAAFLVPGT